MKTSLSTLAAKFALALALLTPVILKAGVLNFSVDINTAALTGAPDGPFFVDFQLNSGGGLSNTATLSGFQFTGGSAAGSASLSGNVTGSLASTVVLNDASPNAFSEFFQAFTPGTTGIHFNASITQNNSGVSPDGFFVSILDSTSGFPQIYTTSPDTLSLLALDIHSANSLADVHAYSSTSPAGVNLTVTAIPEPSYTVVAFGLVSAFAGFRRFRRQQAA